jgi:hypothetical protein
MTATRKWASITAVRRLAIILAPALVSACGGDVQVVSKTTLIITAPVDGAAVFSLDPMAFQAQATNPAGLTMLELAAGDVVVQTCKASMSHQTPLACGTAVSLPTVAAQYAGGSLRLTATATDDKNLKKSASITVTVTPILVSFTQPVAQGSPPVAVVEGTSELALNVRSELPVTSVKVTYGGSGSAGGLPLTQFQSMPYQAMINWPVELQVGQTELSAVATDTQARTGSGTLSVQVQCAQDADCAAHQRCCTQSGSCQDQGVSPACQ